LTDAPEQVQVLRMVEIVCDVGKNYGVVILGNGIFEKITYNNINMGANRVGG
jgi:hypothetical protein